MSDFVKLSHPKLTHAAFAALDIYKEQHGGEKP
jgi:hypothetical protein